MTRGRFTTLLLWGLAAWVLFIWLMAVAAKEFA